MPFTVGLTLSDCYLLINLKRMLGRKRFNSIELSSLGKLKPVLKVLIHHSIDSVPKC